MELCTLFAFSFLIHLHFDPFDLFYFRFLYEKRIVKSNFIYGITGGLVKGVINIIGRTAVGVTDLITFPIPTRPIAQPVYIWNDFDVDTNYGPVFRLDLDEEEETPVVQAPVAEPVAAPAVVAPRPEPIDNSKQYKQETNHKLDEMFKKEMKK